MAQYRPTGWLVLLPVVGVLAACRNDNTSPLGPGSVTIAGIAPDTLVEGQSATLTGEGFSTTPANDIVTIGGLAATVTAATQTSLTVTVPTSNCLPARDAGITASVGGVASNTVNKRLHPAAFLSLAVGEQVIIRDPARFCLQLRASAAGGDAYLVGVSAPAEVPTATLPFRLVAVPGTPAGAATAVQPLPEPALKRPTLTATAPRNEPGQRAQLLADLRLRQWEREHLGPATAAARVAPPARATGMAVPNVGDTIRFRIANFFSSPCDTIRSILTKVKVIGTAGVWVTDISNPATDSLTTAEIQAYSDTFDTHIYPVDTRYFGTLSDIDANQHVLVVLSIAVNKLGDVAGYVFAGDLFARNQCASSNGGEIFYGEVPDPNNVSGTGARAKSDVLSFMPPLIAHEFSHDIQASRRILVGGTTLSAWEAEGQAVLAEEVVGHSVLGNAPGQNYDAGVAFGAGQGARWYGSTGPGGTPFKLLAIYYGWIGGTSKAAGAPEQCTLFGSVRTSTACSVFAFYGASWSLQRYLSDRFGPTYPGGEPGLNRDLIGKNVGLSGVANIEGLGLGVGFDSLFSQWGAMLYADDRVTGDPALRMTSWNMVDVFNAFSSDAFRLIPAERTFTTFSDSRSVRGGSNAYTRLSAAGARPALALRVRDAGDAPLGTTLKPQLWVVRLQ